MTDSHAVNLRETASQLRRDIIESIYTAGSGHSGGSLSAVEILVSLYFDKMNIDPGNPSDPARDRFVLSKGHAAPALYAVLARRGFFPTCTLSTLRQPGSILSGHPACFKAPGVEISSGSLGQGLSVGLGMALAARVTGGNYRVFVLMGDGELQEGEVWEAAMAAAHYRTRGLVAIVDNNHVQLDGAISDVMEIEPLADKWKAFGWQVLACDGHDLAALSSTLDQAILAGESGPVVLLAQTVKGKGVSFMENKAEWHGKPIGATDYQIAMEEIK